MSSTGTETPVRFEALCDFKENQPRESPWPWLLSEVGLHTCCSSRERGGILRAGAAHPGPLNCLEQEYVQICRFAFTQTERLQEPVVNKLVSS